MNLNILVIVALLTLLTACSQSEQESERHVWEEQTEILDQAKETEQFLLDTLKDTEQAIDEAME